ncbi:MAG: (deoxy)nucleoside triphosphate pyrophosphohydrolase [Brevibacterium sp.]
MGETLRVVGAVFEHDGKILACRRRADKAEGSKWEFPGGKIDAGETPQEALRRELTEELGLEGVNVLDLVQRQTTESDGRLIDLACYRISSTTQPKSSTDHDSLLWVAPEQLAELDWALADLPTVSKLVSLDPFKSDTGSKHDASR